MTVAVTFTETVKVEGATYTVDDSPYDLADNLAARFIHRGWATGTISGTVSVTMSAAYKSGGVIYAQGETYEIAQPLAGFLISEGKATPATVPDVAPSNVAIPITVTQPSVSDPAASSQVATSQLVNTSSSEQAANTPTERLAIHFAPGAIPSGQYPQCELDDGTPVPLSIGAMGRHSDGSVSIASVIARIPSAVSGSATIDLIWKNGGSAPSASSLDMDDLVAGFDIKVVGTDPLYGLTSGTWTASVNAAYAASADNAKLLGNGPTGPEYMISAPFNDGSSDHEHFACDFYITILDDGEGGIHSLLMDVRFRNGYIDSTGTIDNIVFKSLVVKNGDDTVATIAPKPSPMTFTRAASNSFTVASAADLQRLAACYLSNSGGALPDGLSADTIYWARKENDTTITLHTTMQGAYSNNNGVTTTDAGSGTHTITFCPYIVTYSCQIMGNGTDGRQIFVAGTGTRTTCRHKHNLADLVKSRLFGPLAQTAANVSDISSAPDFYPLDINPSYITWHEDTGGTAQNERAWLMPSAHRYAYKLTDNCYRATIIPALEYSVSMWALRRKATNLPLNCTDTDFDGFGTKVNTARYRPSSPSQSGVKAPASYARPHGVFAWSHKPAPFQSAYLLSGRSAFLDLCIDQMVSAVMNGGTDESNNPTINGTKYYRATVATGQQTRDGGWQHRDAAWVAIFAPETWRGGAVRDYAVKILETTADALLAWTALLNEFQTTNKFWPVHAQYSTDGSNGSWSTWQGNGYFGHAALLGYLATGDADMKTAIENMLAFWKNAADNEPAGADVYGSYKPYAASPSTVDDWSEITVAAAQNSGQLQYGTMTRAFLYWATALGFDVPAGMREDIDGWWNGDLGDFTTAPTHCFTDAFEAA